MAFSGMAVLQAPGHCQSMIAVLKPGRKILWPIKRTDTKTNLPKLDGCTMDRQQARHSTLSRWKHDL